MELSISEPLTLPRRRVRAERLLAQGFSVHETARLTRETRRQIIRWKNKISIKLSPPSLTLNPDKHRLSAFFERESVTPSKEFFAAGVDGGLEPAAFDHPVDHLEPVEAVTVSAAEKTRLIQLAALNYWMQKEPRPMRAVAAEIGCTPAAISRTLNIISNKLGAKAPCQKSAAARVAYADRQRRLAAEGRGGKNKKPSLTLMA